MQRLVAEYLVPECIVIDITHGHVDIVRELTGFINEAPCSFW
jgi:hypothetical protein